LNGAVVCNQEELASYANSPTYKLPEDDDGSGDGKKTLRIQVPSAPVLAGTPLPSPSADVGGSSSIADVRSCRSRGTCTTTTAVWFSVLSVDRRWSKPVSSRCCREWHC